MLGDLPTSRDEGVKLRMLPVLMFEQIGRHMRQVIETTHAQPLGTEFIDRFAQFTTAVFEQRHRAPLCADEPFQHPCYRLARPGLGHADG